MRVCEIVHTFFFLNTSLMGTKIFFLGLICTWATVLSNFAAKISQLDFTIWLLFIHVNANVNIFRQCQIELRKRFATQSLTLGEKGEIVLLHGKTPSSRPKIALYILLKNVALSTSFIARWGWTVSNQPSPVKNLCIKRIVFRVLTAAAAQHKADQMYAKPFRIQLLQLQRLGDTEICADS